MGQVIVWWLVSTLIGWLAFPLCFGFFHRLPGRGYAFSRILGLLLTSYLLWFGASLHVIQNDLGGLILSLFTTASLSAWSLTKSGAHLQQIRAFLRERWRMILTAEVLFLLCLAGWSVVRAYTDGKIMPVGGEKFMEIAFMNAILNSPQFPPLDPWMSGFSISYYYFGYVMMAFMTRLTGAASGVAFDLYNALLFALSALSAFGLVYEMAGVSRGGSRNDARGAVGAGLLGALFTVGLGNLQGLVEVLYARGWLSLRVAEWLGVPNFPAYAQITGTLNPGSFWSWGWRASRVINDTDLSGQSISLNPITEFPNFSFLLGDNHPHVLALPFGLLAAAAAFQVLRSALSGSPLWSWRLLLTGLITGALVFLNTWDYPVYFGLVLLAWFIGCALKDGRISRPRFSQTVRLGVALAAIMLVGFFPFFTGFSSQAGGVVPYVFPPTRVVQYLIMFGPFIVLLAVFLPVSIAAHNTRLALTLRDFGRWWLRLALGLLLFSLLLLALSGLALWLDGLRQGSLAASLLPYLEGRSIPETVLVVLAQRFLNPWLFLLLTALLTLAAAAIWRSMRREEPITAMGEYWLAQNHADDAPPADPGLLFAWLLALAGLALTFSVEFFYLRDGFGVRMNTVFKFYFQGWLLLAATSAFGWWWLARNGQRILGGIAHAFAQATILIVVLAGLVYPLAGIYSRTSGFSLQPVLDGTSELRRQNPDDWAGIDWLVAYGKIDDFPPVILEAPGKSYNYAGRISAFTGYPAVLGWAVHQMQWRGSYDEQGKREPAIAVIYTDPTSAEARSWLNVWQVDYIIFGEPERDYIREQCSQAERYCSPERIEEAFNLAFDPVFNAGRLTIFAVPQLTSAQP